MQQAHDQDYFALQIIHLLRAILHTIIFLARGMAKAFEGDFLDIEIAMGPENDLADLLRMAPLLTRQLEM
jgi:hypothetical protein